MVFGRVEAYLATCKGAGAVISWLISTGFPTGLSSWFAPRTSPRLKRRPPGASLALSGWSTPRAPPGAESPPGATRRTSASPSSMSRSRGPAQPWPALQQHPSTPRLAASHCSLHQSRRQERRSQQQPPIDTVSRAHCTPHCRTQGGATGTACWSQLVSVEPHCVTKGRAHYVGHSSLGKVSPSHKGEFSRSVLMC